MLSRSLTIRSYSDAVKGATGLFVSWNGPLLIPAATRLQGIFFWDLV